MKLIQPSQRPSTPPAVCVSGAHESVVGRLPAWAMPAMGRSARLLAVGGQRYEGRSVSTHVKFAGARIPAVNTRLTGAERGVPPRGRPV